MTVKKLTSPEDRCAVWERIIGNLSAIHNMLPKKGQELLSEVYTDLIAVSDEIILLDMEEK